MHNPIMTSRFLRLRSGTPHLGKILAITLATITPGTQAVSLLDDGINLGASYEVGVSPQTLNGDGDGDPSSKQRLTLNLAADLDKLWGWSGSRFFAQYQNHHGESGGEHVHDIQQYDGLDDPEYDRIHMFWFQQRLFDEQLRIKVGKVEPKSEFFAPENARNHLGFSTERSPTIIAQGPPSMSLNVFYTPNNRFSLGLGVYDAAWNEGRDENTMTLHNPFDAPSDLAIFLESRFQWTEGYAGLPGGFKAGVWQLSGTKARFDGQANESSTEGYYLVLDQTLTTNGIGIYAQYGIADEDVSHLSQHIGLGMQWLGPFASRQDDVFGVGISSVEFSDVSGSPFTASRETAYEIFYKGPVTSWLTLQGDLQQIENPGGRGAPDALVASFRATFRF